MGALIRIMFPLIAYFCVATVITLTAGYGYLRHSGALEDENMFKIVSILHGIDLDEVAYANQTDQQDVPPEELSFEDRRKQVLMASLHKHSKNDDIEKNISIFKAKFNSLNNKIKYYATFRREAELFLEERKKQATASGIAGVRDQWKNLNAKNQTKQLLVRMIKDGQMDRVIDLLNGLPPKKRTDILKTFVAKEDIDMLYQIEQRMLAGGPEAKFIEDKLQELNQKGN